MTNTWHALSPQQRLNNIVENGVCIGCGLCEAAAGAAKVRALKVTTGHIRPVASDELDHEAVGKIYDICPGTRVNGLPERLIEEDTQIDHVWGAHRRIVLAYAGDPEVRFEGSTGGVLTALGQYLLETGRVDFILHTRASKADPTFGESTLSFTAADVWEAAGSRYGPTATLSKINDALDRGQPFAFMGKPCDIGALRNYARHDARVDELVKYWLTLVCGGYMPPAAMDGFLNENGIDPKDVTAFRYRGRGCPGPTRLETRQGSVKELRYTDFWGEDESSWSLPFRCKICPDGIGESADIAASDTWLGGSPNPETEDFDKGANAMIARTSVGQELLEAAIRDGALGVKRGGLTPEDMSEYQPHQVKKKYAVWARFRGLEAEGCLYPQTGGLRIEQLASELDDAFNDTQTSGTRQRVRDGKTSEPVPLAAE